MSLVIQLENCQNEILISNSFLLSHYITMDENFPTFPPLYMRRLNVTEAKERNG